MDHRSRGSCWGKVGNVLCFPSFPQPFPTLRDPSPDCGEYVVPGWSGPTHYKAGIPLTFWVRMGLGKAVQIPCPDTPDLGKPEMYPHPPNQFKSFRMSAAGDFWALRSKWII